MFITGLAGSCSVLLISFHIHFVTTVLFFNEVCSDECVEIRLLHDARHGNLDGDGSAANFQQLVYNSLVLGFVVNTDSARSHTLTKEQASGPALPHACVRRQIGWQREV